MNALTCGLSLQAKHLFVSEIFGLLSAPLLAFGVLHLGAAESQKPDGGHAGRLAHFHQNPSGHHVPAAEKRLSGVRKNHLKGLYPLRHGHHDAVFPRSCTTVVYLCVFFYLLCCKQIPEGDFYMTSGGRSWAAAWLAA